jgi:membrane dipeptidase
MISFFVRSSGTATIEDYLDHIDHIVKVAGVEHAGLGSDVDAEGRGSVTRSTSVAGLRQGRKIYDIAEGLLRRKYGKREIELILGGNFQRVLSGIWAA